MIEKTCFSWSMASVSEVKLSKSPLAPDLGLPDDGDIARRTGEKKLVAFV